jgi:SAM-dependent methyltransferase
MNLKDKMNDIYKNLSADRIPWNRETIPAVLRDIVKTGKVKPCRTLELGCGFGTYAIYFQKNGYDVMGVDFSEAAIDTARTMASRQNADCTFIVADVLGDLNEMQSPFDFVFDWELLHHIFPENRERYLNNVHRLLNPGKPYVSVFFSEESPQFGGKGKYRVTPLGTRLYFSSEDEIKSLVKPVFDIDELKTIEIEGKMGSHKAIYAFLKKK